MRKLLLFFVLIFLALVVTWSVLPEPWRRAMTAAMGWKSFVANEAAQKNFDGQDYSMALNKWGEALAQSHNRPDLLFNLSLGLQLLQKNEDAVKSYQAVIKDPRTPDQLKFPSYFNRGVMAQADKNIDQALVEYQAALDFNPTSVETKTNIELLLAGGGSQGKSNDKSDKGKGDKKDDQQQDGEGDKDKKDKDKPKEYAKNQKPQPKPFKSEQLDQSDVNKILGEIRQQEQKIRSEFNKREVKEQPRDKDW